ncbi:hypothetical protein, partial [Ralstonia syzygii]
QPIVVIDLTVESVERGKSWGRSSVLRINGRFHTASTQSGSSRLSHERPVCSDCVEKLSWYRDFFGPAVADFLGRTPCLTPVA